MIELLVVIAIIALLAGILFQVFAKAREKAKQATCTGNLKQLGLAALMYAGDWDEQFPMGIAAGGLDGWYAMQALAPYIPAKYNGVCTLTHDNNMATTQLILCPSIDNQGKCYSSYGWNAYTVHEPASASYYGQLQGMSDLSHPDKIIMMADIKGNTSGFGAMTIGKNDFSGAAGNYTGWPAFIDYRHSGGANILYWDGHVQLTLQNLVGQRTYFVGARAGALR